MNKPKPRQSREDFSRVYLVSQKLDRVTHAEVRELQTAGIALPRGYEEYVTTLGAGDYCGEISIYQPKTIPVHLQEFRDRVKGHYCWDEYSEILSPQDVARSFPIGENCGPDEMIYFPGDPPGIYVCRHEDSDFQFAGTTLYQALDFMCDLTNLSGKLKFPYFRSRHVRDGGWFTEVPVLFHDFCTFLLQADLDGIPTINNPDDEELLVFFKGFSGLVSSSPSQSGMFLVYIMHDFSSPNSQKLERILAYIEESQKAQRHAPETGTSAPSIEHFLKLMLETHPLTDAHMDELVKLYPRIRELQLHPSARVTEKGYGSIGRLSNLRCLELLGVPISDPGLLSLKGLVSLRKFRLDGQPSEFRTSQLEITHDGLQFLAGMPNLETLEIRNCPINGPGLAAIRSCHLLKRLLLINCGITDESLANLENLLVVEDLWLEENCITDSGLVHLKRLTKLWRLGLSKNNIVGSGLPHLRDCKNLRDLCLSGTAINDENLCFLEPLRDTKLAWLNLRATGISDRGITFFRSWTRLRNLVVTNTKVTKEAAEELHRLLPQMNVVLD